ncbi:MAG: FliH/SctL family protein [Pseudomonadota bacterium]|nr:FliH/SctL family protein [Pseudomonadota bacterium]
MASSKVAYVAFGEDASIGFAGDDVLNRPSHRSFEDPPWKVIDSDIHFKPMFVEGFEPVDGIGGVSDDRTETVNSSNTEGVSGTLETESDESDVSIQTDEDPSEWAEVIDVESLVTGVSEEEVVNRVEEAVANARAELMDEYSQKISELEASITSLKSDHETECQQIREQTKADAEAKVDKAIQQYRELTQKIRTASTRVSEFFEPVSRLSVHIAEQLVRGELTVGPVAITRLVQGCLDAIEERASKKEPILKMHPADLEMFLNGFDGELTGVSLVADDRLARGDVSLQMDHSVIDDLLSHRLEEIAQYVFGRSTTDGDLLLDEENDSTLAEDSISIDEVEAVLTDASDLAENPSHEEPELPEIKSHADDPMVSNELENQMLDDSTETQEDFEADALAETGNLDVSLLTDNLGEGQIDEDDTEIDDTDQSE